MQARSDQLMAALPGCFVPVPAQLVVGGGTLPDEFYPAPALECTDPRPAQQLLDALRELPVPVIATVRQQKVLLNMATLLPAEMDLLIAQLRELLLPPRSMQQMRPRSPDPMTPYRAVIGLAGHVDHGKTLLIKALTGITTARAHEQAIGMTQDLGFAHFDDGQGNTIGVIDVPGHERYIRNMVAGLWSLDLVLLVIAADEGWMPMTGDHLRLLKAMGVPRLVVCINKCDLVAPDELALLEECLLERVMDESGMVPDIVSVSAKTGANMAALHAAIVGQLADLPASQTTREQGAPRCSREEAPPRLYVDRVFTANGTGTVLTGTLQQGRLKVGDKLRLYPADREVQIRSLQAYHQSALEIGAVCRVAVGLKKVPHKEVARGHCLTSAAGQCEAATHLIVRLNAESLSSKSLRPSLHPSLHNKEVEVALGSWHGRARLYQ